MTSVRSTATGLIAVEESRSTESPPTAGFFMDRRQASLRHILQHRFGAIEVDQLPAIAATPLNPVHQAIGGFE